MIKRLLCLIFILSFHFSYSQYIDIALIQMMQNIEQLNLEPIESTETDWMNDNWSATVFNPYKETKKEYPFQVRFKDSIFASPINRKKVVTSRYGWRRGRAHKGIDIDLVTGDSVMTMFDGKVRLVKYEYGLGKTIVVRHYNGLETVYGHLSKQLVKVNDSVKKGDLIGKGGATGNARGSHLHLIVSYKGIYINPEYLFDFGLENEIRGKDIWVTRNWTTPSFHNSKRQSKLDIYHTLEEAEKSLKFQKQIYTIKRGDTLYRISNKYQVSISTLCKTNSIKRTSTLKIGQRLVLIP